MTDWARLRDAYGSAEGLPAVIESLSAPSQATRESAVHSLWGSLCHQGTVYTASVAAVPLLAEVVRTSSDPAVQGHLLSMLGSIASAWTHADDSDEWAPQIPYRLLPTDRREGQDPVDLSERCRNAVAAECPTLTRARDTDARWFRVTLLALAAAVGDAAPIFALSTVSGVADDPDSRVAAAARLVSRLAEEPASISMAEVEAAAALDEETAAYLMSAYDWPPAALATEVAGELASRAILKDWPDWG